MPQEETTQALDRASLEARIVRYVDLQPCTTAFIDTRTPGSAEKENFTIIGPGVAENPDQHVHITIPHGFNIGGARQPPRCTNSQHSHETVEVFVVHSGTWAFRTGEHGEDGEVILQPGDTISIPVRIFRGFENVGEDEGFLFAVLGGDDPGHVTWAPYVFESARSHGLILLENGQLVDTTKGERVPANLKPVTPTTAAQVASMTRVDSKALARCVVPHSGLGHAPAASLPGTGVFETAIIGDPASEPGSSTRKGAIEWPHGFQLRHLRISPEGNVLRHSRPQAEVLFVHRGTLTVKLQAQEFVIGPGDVFTLPINCDREFFNSSAADCEIYVVHGTDNPTIDLS